MSRRHHGHALVIGAGVAGLGAARVLADRFDAVTVLDRDQLPESADARKGVPQGRHAHALLAGGARAIAGMFPGIMEELVAGGAALIEFNDGFWHQAGGYRAASLVERKVVSASRPFIEANIRRRVRELPNVRIESGLAVETLIHDGGRVRGVRAFDGRRSRELVADLVVDCSGRASRASLWMEEAGYRAPDVREVRCDVRYGTTIVPRSRGDLDGTFAVIIESPPDGKRAAFLIPIERDRWIVTIAATFGAEVPTDEASFHAIAATLPSPKVAEVLSKAGPMAPVVNHRMVSSKWRRYDKLTRLPAGFLALGDAICSFNPIYGQGMSSGVLQAVELAACLDSGSNDETLVRMFYKRAAKVIAIPWQLSAENDLAYPENAVSRPVRTDLVNRYMKRVLLAAQVSAEVNTKMILVQNLVMPRSTLFKPSFVRSVLAAAREAERRIADGRASDRQPLPLSA
jgi:2-polyprenyl-6-methoxyphenol hydroxylase-like FAD-dependent oxidoreductase